MPKITHVCATAIALAMLAAPAWSQSQSPTSDPAKPQTQMQDKSAPATPPAAEAGKPAGTTDTLLTEQSPSQDTADQLIGMTVLNTGGEEIGEITDLVIEEGSIVGAVVGVGGFLGIGTKDVGVGWAAVQVEKRDGEKVAVVDLTKQELEAAQAFKPYRPEPPAGVGTGTGGTGTAPTGTYKTN